MIIKNIFKIFVIFLVAIQPLHNYAVVGANSSDDKNGFNYLHAELCGSKYSDSFSHTKKIANLLDKINIAVLSETQPDSFCCDSQDTIKLELSSNIRSYSLLTSYALIKYNNFYAPNVKSLIPYTYQVRAPPHA